MSTPSGFAVVDLETTGLSARENRILELGIVCTDPAGIVATEWTSRFNPDGPVGATHIHGIRYEDVASAPRFAEQIAKVVSLLEGRALVAHNAVFDLAFLRAEFARAGWEFPDVPVFCTLKESWFYLPDLNGRRLPDCCKAAGIRLQSSHVALSDARATAGLLRLFLDPRTPPPPVAAHLALVSRAAVIRWPSAPSGRPIVFPTPAPRPTSRRRAEPIKLTPRLIATLADYSFEDALDEGAPEGSSAYLQLLVEVLEDGVLTVEEGFALAELAEAYGLAPDELRAAHRGLLTAVARKAVEDDVVSREEREELRLVARLLDLPEKLVPNTISAARDQRAAALGEGLPALPDDWAFGEPLRVGDKIAITGCEEYGRLSLEQRAKDRGIIVSGGVSRVTVLLVADGSVQGGKAQAAAEYGTRVVHPNEFEQLLAHVQPPLPKPPKASVSRETARRIPQTVVGVDPSIIRAWARANGYEVGVRGRIHQDVIDAYARAQQAPDLPQKP